MENRKSYILTTAIFIAVGVFFAVQPAAAYEVNTHTYLTKESIELYNNYTEENKISDELKRYVIDGAIHEDDDPRYKNHFYDPINNKGLKDVFRGVSAKEWANDEKSQNNIEYKPGAKTSLVSIDQQKIDKYGKVTNFTWNAALRYWLKGDKEMAMEALGYVLHLVEDMGVPEHTRNDSHAKGSRYEEYASRYNSDTPDEQLKERIGDKKPASLKSLDKYFDGLAKYSNKYFYSPGSLGMYDFPELDYKNAETKEGKYYIVNKDDEGVKYYLAIKKNIANVALGYTDVFVDREPILDSYWPLLSVRTVRYSAGVIDLFFRDVERAKNDPDLFKEETAEVGIGEKISGIASSMWSGTKDIAVKTGSFFSSVLKAVGSGIVSSAKFVGGLFENDGQLVDVGSVDLLSDDTGTVERAETEFSQKSSRAVKKEANAKLKEENTALKLQLEQLKKEAQIQDKAVVQLEKKQERVVTEDEIATTTQAKKIPASAGMANTPVCVFDTNNKTGQKSIIINEVAWMGGVRSASDEWIELKNISGNDIDVSGWQLLNKGGGIKVKLGGLKTPIIKPGQFILLERTDNNSAVGATASLIYSGALANSSEGLKLFDSACGVIDEIAVSAHWPAGSNESKQTMERNSGGYGWHTSSMAGGTPKKENSAGVSYSGGGGGSAAVSVATQNGRGGDPLTPRAYPKLLINKIQLASASSTHDEFVELYNPNDTAIDLTDWYVQKKTKTASDLSTYAKADLFSGKQIAARGVFVIAHPSSTVAYAVATNYIIADDNALVIKNPNGDIVDKVGWGAANDCEGICVANPADGQYMQRKIADGVVVDTDNNKADFALSVLQSPIVLTENATTTISEGGVTNPATVTSSQLVRDAISGPLSVATYYQSLATSTAYTIGSFSVYSSGITGKWRGGVCEFNPLIPRCVTVLAQTFADVDMPGGDVEALLTFNFSTSVVLNTGKLYALYVEPTGSVLMKDRVSRVRGSSIDAYPGGKAYAFGQYEPYYISEAVDPGIADIYFAISTTTTITVNSTSTGESSGQDLDDDSPTTTISTLTNNVDIVINEIAYDPLGNDTDREWVELYNKGTISADLADWRFVEDGVRHELAAIQGTSTLGVGEYAIITNDIAGFLGDHPGFGGTVFRGSFSLNNNESSLGLKNGDLVIDTASYASSTGANGDGMSLQKFSDGWHAASPTPGAKNVLAPVVEVATNIAMIMTATTTGSSDGSATSTNKTVQLPTLAQLDSSIKSSPLTNARYAQFIGRNKVATIKTVRMYGESDLPGRWHAGICITLTSSCAQLAGVSSNEDNTAINTKAPLVFDFGAVALDPAAELVLYFSPPTGAKSSVYGASAYNAYVDGGLTTYIGIGGEDVGVHDMYFEIY